MHQPPVRPWVLYASRVRDFRASSRAGLIFRPQACNFLRVIPEIDIWRAANLMAGTVTARKRGVRRSSRQTGGRGPRKNGAPALTPGKMISRAVPPLGAICVPSARFSRSSSRAGLIFLEPVAPTCLAPLRPWSISTFDASSLC